LSTTGLPAGTTRNRTGLGLLWALALTLLLICVLALLIGRYPVPGIISLQQLSGDELAGRLFLNLRLPRLLTSLLLGASLSAAGMVFQTLFNNPLVEPGFLGVSQGAAFGAALCIVFLGGSAAAVQGSAVLFAFLGLGLSYLLARRIRYGGWVLRLVLSGITVSAMFSAGLGLLKYLADPLSQLPEITFWLLGGLSGITWPRFVSILPAVLSGLILLTLYRWRLNLLSLNEEIAFSLGAAPRRERLLLLSAAVLATAAVISVAGMVGWVGLIVPHLARRLLGSDTRLALPAAMMIGGIYVVFCDTLARSILAGEIPLGILTSLFGAVAFFILMTTRGFQIQR
jgi:iron complex transport system permease protein